MTESNSGTIKQADNQSDRNEANLFIRSWNKSVHNKQSSHCGNKHCHLKYCQRYKIPHTCEKVFYSLEKTETV